VKGVVDREDTEQVILSAVRCIQLRNQRDAAVRVYETGR